MIDVTLTKTFLAATLDKVIRLNWSGLVPEFRVDRYPDVAFGFEPTLKRSFGLCFGLGHLDVWFGWPKRQKPLDAPTEE